jgi:hypothetical protein
LGGLDHEGKEVFRKVIDSMAIPEILLQLLWMTPIVVGLVEIVKRFGVDSKFLPLCGIALAEMVVYGYAYSTTEFTRFEWLMGLMIGLEASGLYSAVKNVAQGLTHKA